MPAIPKIAGIASILASLNDIHKTAMVYARQEGNKTMANNIISCSLGSQKTDYISFKDAQRKNWTKQQGFFFGTKEIFASIGGYINGALQGVARYAPKLVLSAMAIIPKTKAKTLSYVSTVALACLEVWDYCRHGTGVFEKTDYLDRK